MSVKKYYWLKMKDDFFNDRTIKKLRKIAGGDTYTIIYLKLLLISLKNEGRIIFEGVEDTFAEEMALEIDEEIDDVKITISYLLRTGLMEQQDEEHFFMTTIPESIGSETADAARMRKKRAKIKALEEKKYGEIECSETNNVRELFDDVQKCSTEIDIEKDIDIDIKENCASNNAPSKSDISSFFESIWLLYPNKKGKGQVSDSKKKVLYQIGYEELKRAIDRYKKDLAADSDWRKPQNGSTFFNSGYVDYLDANYTPPEIKAVRTEPVPSWMYKNQNNYDFEQLENELMANQSKAEEDP